MQIKWIVFQALTISLVTSVPLVAEDKAVAGRSVESSAATPSVLVARQSETDLANNPQPPPGIQDFFDRIRGKGKGKAKSERARGAAGARANGQNA
ncbi:hypothetical protein MGG_17463 [Pyricularia oryzae 70-15]|uniref:Uncharacterized protein n=3 Tax=Pyricularia oryzae TaxID=318829 RepID=G4NCD2_PYRO7|nr:uncharacterized protein MGG_17463 [Pyricularia oryzae 70-15]EHA49081.1 hypothetical protein MGG_17463 [Pyricularia oryzae 70-15]ELQ42622.1 hypothetical protein OOU_Y34scaffold00203g111 [Pyricularia oryzae Y34]KAI7916635.1 hypothetical protein M0657_008476 [Pyricularia oryzae]KAI7929383.1 hypothetical protein M9X92_001271 [Pyricularia oryzae]